MIGIVITGHGHFAKGLGSGLQLITGITEKILLVDFEESHSLEVLTGNLLQAYDKLKDCDGILVCSDLAGGTPFKTAVECKYTRPEQNIEVIAGVNLPMLLEGTMMMSSFKEPFDMAEALISAGRDYIVRFDFTAHEDHAEEDGI